MTAVFLILMPGVADAGHNDVHDGYHIEVTPEVEVVPFGTDQAILTAIIVDGPEGARAVSSLNIDFENEGDADGATFKSPDLTCTIPADGTECSVTVARGAGNDLIRAWVDTDNLNSTEEADNEEARVSNPATDCNQEQDVGGTGTGSDCIERPLLDDSTDPGNAQECAGESPFSQSLSGYAPEDEPDCTDVVRVSWQSAPSEMATVDCDDDGGTDTERETNSDAPPEGSTAEDGSSEEYTCTARNQFGNVLAADVYGEVENGINDPDVIDGASYDEPDYLCEASTDILGRPIACTVDVFQAEDELGTAEICWWGGQPSDGAALCADEPTGEAQVADGSDAGNDRADQTELTWEDPSGFLIDCEPETDSNPVGTAHDPTCLVTSGSSQRPITGQQVDWEITGQGDPDATNSPQNPDDTCTTGEDGRCSIQHTSASTGQTTYRAWVNDQIDEPRLSNQDPAVDQDIDRTEGQNESATPGEYAEPDGTDVVTNTWTPAPTTLTITPKSDSAQVGECNPYTITASRGSGEPVEGVTIDVEQRHASADDETTGNEPAVSFCIPATGPNPSDVDEDEGDLQPAADPADEGADEEDPDNQGTAGGETVKDTDAKGQVTIGISIAPGGTSDGTGTVTIRAFFDPNDNDDIDSGEPSAEATKTWTPAPEPGGRSISCEPETATTETDEEHIVTCTVTNAEGGPDAGKGVDFTESGPGEIIASDSVTDANGEASATLANSTGELGEQTIMGTLRDANEGEPNADECERPANDPTGAQAGQCSDSVTNTWVEPVADCSDGEDNDGDGQTDFPDDNGCSSAEDNSEGDEKCPGQESASGNHIVGTEGDDSLEGTEGADVICGLGGNDLILGLGGDDLILGGGGNDSLRGDDGNDTIKGNSGKDELRGNGGNDELRGGNQNDDLRGNAGDDVMRGQAGFDVLRGGNGDDEGQGGSGNDTIQGFTGNDKLVGNSGNDTIKGGGGRDDLRGGKNDDVISGGAGPDRIRGGPGRDACAGGGGNNDVRGCES